MCACGVECGAVAVLSVAPDGRPCGAVAMQVLPQTGAPVLINIPEVSWSVGPGSSNPGLSQSPVAPGQLPVISVG